MLYIVDNLSGIPVYEQIINQTEKFILEGILSADEPMPSVRSVATQIPANPNTIQKAYTQMLGRGLIYTVPGKGSFVSRDARLKLIEACKLDLKQIKDMSLQFARAGIDKNLVIEAVERGYAAVVK